MLFIETPIFTKLILQLMTDEKYSELQEALVLNPELGDLIRGSGGLRKVRWGLEGRGKRGGCKNYLLLEDKSKSYSFFIGIPKKCTG